MSEQTKTDWQLGLSLFVQGVPYAEIANRISVKQPCLRQHARRHDWHRLRTQTAIESSRATGKLPRDLANLADQSNRVRLLLTQDVARSVETLPRMPQTANPTGFLRRQKVVTEVAQTARVLFAWNEDTRPSIRIGVVNMASVRAPGEPHPPAIDVEVTTPIADALATDEPPLGSAA